MATFRRLEVTGRARVVWRAWHVAGFVYDVHAWRKSLGQDPEPIDDEALGLYDGLTDDERMFVAGVLLDSDSDPRARERVERVYGPDPYRDSSEAFEDRGE